MERGYHRDVATHRDAPIERQPPGDEIHSPGVGGGHSQVKVSEEGLGDNAAACFAEDSLPRPLQRFRPPLQGAGEGTTGDMIP